jgi:glycosyltransferase involved in cell wall biosynthesis
MPELVSILIPAYNAEKWLGETIRSALNQTWPRIEIIIVDDGSSDNTAEIARSFASSSVKTITQQNSGPCVARNAAYALSQGDFIQWLDADDLLAPDKIEQQMQRAQQAANQKLLLYGACGTFYYSTKRARFEATSNWGDMSPKEALVRKFTQNAHIVLHSWLVSRTLAELAGPWDVRLQKTDADGEYSSRLIAKSEGLLSVPDARCYYRKGLSGSLSATRTSMDEEKLLLRLLFDHLFSLEDSAESRDACVTWLETWASSYYPINREAFDVAVAMARELDRPLGSVPVSAKFYVTEKLVGWRAARASRFAMARIRTLVRRLWERFLGLLPLPPQLG